MQVSFNTKLEVAVEILAAKIAETSEQGYTIKDEKMAKLLMERDAMYKGRVEIIKKIINEYGPEIKKKYEGV